MLPEWLERLRAAREDPWVPLRTPAVVATLVTLGLLTLPQFGSGDGWTPVLDGANLVFHEAGHPLFAVFGETFGLLGGTLLQLMVPAALATTFWVQRHPASTALAGAWAFQNLWNIARYVADARSQCLPLVGGGEHDWALLLGRWGLLAQDQQIAGVLRVLGWAGVLGCGLWAATRWWRDRALTREGPGSRGLR